MKVLILINNAPYGTEKYYTVCCMLFRNLHPPRLGHVDK